MTTLRFLPDPAAIVDPALKEWADDAGKELIDQINLYGGYRAAARIRQCDHAGLKRRVQTIERRAALAGYSPRHDMKNPVPEGFNVRGVSTYYDKDGNARGQWVKSRADDDARAEMLRAAFAAMSEDVPRVASIPAPDHVDDALCNVFTLTDCHVGMLAWRKEGGADWDTAIAERTLIGAFEQMVTGCRPASTCVVNQLGDFLHYDGLMPVTPTSGHMLDADGRFSKMVRAAIRILRRVIDIALARHKTVLVVMAEGNHDMASSVWLRIMFAALYENEPRVRVIDSELPYYVHVHGETMLAFHHGHLKKNDQLPLLFAAQFPREWGATTKRFAHVGHRHHEEIKEHSGMKVVQHSTLAARDAYAARGGWMSERQATAYTYHARWGQVGAVTVCPEMLEAA